MDGRHYRFVDEAEFRAKIAEGGFAEYETYRSHLYGTPSSEIDRVIEGGRDLLLEIDVRGARSIKKLYPEALAIFIYPPDPADLAKRLRGRGTDTPDQIQARLEAAREELAQQDDFDHAVLNDQVSRAVERIEAILGLSSHQ